MRAGAHVDSTDPVAAAVELGANASQFFLGDPQGWKGPDVAYAGGADGAAGGRRGGRRRRCTSTRRTSLNVATTNNRIRIPSRKLLQQHVDAAAEIGAAGLIVHGGHVLDGGRPARSASTTGARRRGGSTSSVPLLIENTAGGDNAMARHLDRIARLWDAIAAAPAPTGSASASTPATPTRRAIELSGLVDRVLAITGRIDLVHCNDSRDAFDSGADRHANLGQGQFDPDGLAGGVRAPPAPRSSSRRPAVPRSTGPTWSGSAPRSPR